MITTSIISNFKQIISKSKISTTTIDNIKTGIEKAINSGYLEGVSITDDAILYLANIKFFKLK